MPSIEQVAITAGVQVAKTTAVEVSLRLLRPSSVRQPRSTNFNVDDLIATMGDPEIGLIHAIWVRTRVLEPPDPELGDKLYEIVVGERRSLAADRLKWPTIRAEIHDELSDLDVFIIQNAENDARRNLTPFEQADAVAKLMAPKSEEGFGITDVAEIAARMKISESVAYQRIALAQASRPVRDAFYQGRLHLGSAIAICSLYDQDLQAQAVQECLPVAGESPYPVRRVQRLVQDRYHLRLASAPFDTANPKLVDGVPACGACPKRAGSTAQQSLFTFDDAATPPAEDERCTDRRCFISKRAAARAQKVDAARALGIAIIDGPDGANMFPAGRFLQSKATGLVALDDKPAGGGGKTYRELLNGKAVVKAVAVDADDRVHELADKEAVRAAISGKVVAPEAPGPAAPQLPEKSAKTKGTTPVPEKDDGFVMQRKAEEAGGTDAIAEMVKLQQRRKMTPQWLRFVLRAVIALASSRSDLLQHIVERREQRTKEHKGKKDQEVLLEAVAEFDEEESAGLLTEIAAAMDGLHPGDNEDHALSIAARFYKVDIAEFVGTRLREVKAQAKKDAMKGQPAPQPEPKPAQSSRKTAAQKSVETGGKCSACGCTDRDPCSDANGDGCVWADVEQTLCSVCANAQGIARDILEEGNRTPTVEEITNMIRDRLDEEEPTTREQIMSAVNDAIARGQIIHDTRLNRLRLKGARVIEKSSTEGATPQEISLKERVVKFLRAKTDKRGTRKELLAHFKGLPATEVLRAVLELTSDKLVKGGGSTEPVELIAPAYEEAIEQLDGLKLPELKARFAHVFGTAAPQLGAVEIKKRIAARLSGESGPMAQPPSAPKRNG